MPSSHAKLYIHLVWSTWDRLSLITPTVEAELFRVLAQKCRELGCLPIAIGGAADHVHVLVSLHPAIAVATLVKEMKGASSHAVAHSISPGEFFRWQTNYGAFSVSPDIASTVGRYIARQKEHHATGDVRAEWETSPSARGPER